MKKICFLSLVMIISLDIYSFSKNEVTVDAKSKVIVGLILNETGLGDQLVNDSCYLGLEKAANEGLITLRTLSITSDKNFNFIVDLFKNTGVDYIYTIGDEHKKKLLEEAKKNPEIMFVGVDILFKPNELKPNISGITFQEQEGGYLAGLLAGNMTYKYHKRYELLNNTNKVGVILGKSTPSNKRYELGFYAGVKEVNPPCEIITIDINDLNNPDKGKKAVEQMKKKGIDIIFTVAGLSETGVFEAAKEQGILVIGSNKDRSLESEMVLTSVVKELSVSSYLMTKKLLSGEFTGGDNIKYGICEKALYLSSYYLYDKYIPREVKVYIRKSCDKLSGNSDIIPASISEIEFDSEDIPEIVE